MLVKYKGSQAAMTMSVGGVAVRLEPGKPAVLNKAQAKELQARTNVKNLVKAKVIEFSSLDSLNKDELTALAVSNGHKVTSKDKVSDLLYMLQGDDDEDDAGTDDGTGTDNDPAE